MTRQDKALIRAYYRSSYYALRFLRDGSVMAQRTQGFGWGLLYSNREALSHLATVRKQVSK